MRKDRIIGYILLFGGIMSFVNTISKMAEQFYTPVEDENYFTPDNPEEAFAKAPVEERKALYNPAVESIKGKEREQQMSMDRSQLRLKPGEETFGTGKLFDSLQKGYLHKKDKNFTAMMNQLISPIEGGISRGVRDASGKLVMRPTNRGVEDKFYHTFLDKRKLQSPADITQLSEDDTREILYRDLWKHYNLDKVKDPVVASLIFDSALNSGHRAIGNLVKQHIPRDILGVDNPTTFGSRAAEIMNTISDSGAEGRDRLLVNLLRQRRKILETAPNFNSPELGAGLQKRLQELERYTEENLKDKSRMQRYWNDPSTAQSHNFYRMFKDLIS